MIIKGLFVNKTTGQLVYQLAHDQDVMGRIWALQQLATRMNDTKTAGGDRQSIIKAIADTATNDEFWGTRLEAVTSLTGSKEAKDTLLTATRHKNARVRAPPVSALAATTDPSLATAFLQFLNDPSYAVIRAAAFAFGETKNPSAYNDLTKLRDVPSWR